MQYSEHVDSLEVQNETRLHPIPLSRYIVITTLLLMCLLFTKDK